MGKRKKEMKDKSSTFYHAYNVNAELNISPAKKR